VKNFSFIIKELLLTFSAQESLFSSKKIERFLAFIISISLTVLYILFNIRTMTSEGFTIVIAPLITYSMYNSYRTHQDKKLKNSNGPDI